MAYEFKRLSEVVVAEEVTNETNVLIEEDGIIKKTARRNIGNVKSVNGVEPNEAGDVLIEIPEPPASFSQVTYYITGSADPYLYVDSGATTKVTAADIASLIAEGKNIFTIKMTGAPFPHAVYPMCVMQLDEYFTVAGWAMGEFMYFYTAEYEEEEPVGPPV